MRTSDDRQQTFPGKRPARTARRNAFPWWLSVLLAAALYMLLTYLPPRLVFHSPGLQKFVDFAPQLAPLVAIPLLLLAAKQLYDDAPPPDDQSSDTTEDGARGKTAGETDAPLSENSRETRGSKGQQ